MDHRTWTNKAPISETLASTDHADTLESRSYFSGSVLRKWYFLIEAALMAERIWQRNEPLFLRQKRGHVIPKQLWYDTVEEAQEMVDLDVETDLQGYDLDPI